MSTIEERLKFWENSARESAAEAEYYREELVTAHALIGRMTQQLSLRWDTVRLTKYYPTDNLHNKRRVGNARGV